ncbi:Gfo/Idh/MocA family oxidoreductase [bacterium]|nr:Gfo/Idh/MocA family oxidoreductase [bacterium]
MKKNIAIVGCGHWGKNLVRNFYELGVLHSICDTNHLIIKPLSEKYQTKISSFDQILDNSDIEGVVLVVPAQLHAEMAVKAMNKGKHVFVEKPLALNEDEAKLMIATSKKNNVQLMVGHLLQYHPIFKAIKKMVKNDKIGKLNYICSNRSSFGIVRSKEDVIWSFAPHDVSMILSLAGEDPELVSCKSINVLQNNLADIASIHMKFKSGLKSDIRVSWLNPYKEVKLVVSGKSGILVFDDTKPWKEKLALYNYKVENSENALSLKKYNEEYIQITEEEPLKNECKDFINVVNKKLRPLTDGVEGLRVVKVLNAATTVENK